jgi:hypothetical protein
VQGCPAGRGTTGSAVTVFADPICGVLGAVYFCAKAGTLMRAIRASTGTMRRKFDKQDISILLRARAQGFARREISKKA